MKVFGSKEEGKEDHPGSDGGMEGLRIRTAFGAAGGIVHSGSRGTKRAAKSTPGGPFLGENETEDKTCRRAGKRLSDRSEENGPRSGGRRKENRPHPGKEPAKNA
ncbi:MAG: hypothetical protein C6P37_10670 [Caldibacillus debilis]|uniref:Uncharacterized protein n=1 Tax=Caldibacillus debilis TaxID=301148 RepID=A0A3E0K393_9BACI|nr:MAG: hypothetical protein C6W57_06270 [Caldibacillus debilis]REJ27573.1 MAG: hypothetical protein C6P37_10670 [Caldibacillus debilis]REJ29684.1 MAG: hypothetical protein C6W56_05425 [Caldibacillus debilis]